MHTVYMEVNQTLDFYTRIHLVTGKRTRCFLAVVLQRAYNCRVIFGRYSNQL